MATTLDYSTLRNGHTGDVLLYHKPPAMELERFHKQVSAMRSYYKKHCGVLTTQTNNGDTVEVSVVKGTRQPKLHAAESVLLENSETDSFDLPANRHGLPESFMALSPDMHAHMVFFSDVFLKSLELLPSAPAEVHAACANAAVSSFRMSFGGH